VTRAVLALASLGCAPAHPAETGGDTGLPGPDCLSDAGPTRLEVALESGAFGALGDGSAVPVSYPPQGGAPYTPLAYRLTGLGDVHLGQRVVARARDGAEELGVIEMDLRPICSNVPPNDGWWMGFGVHLRYDGLGLDALDGRSVALTVDVGPVPSTGDAFVPVASWGTDVVLDAAGG
jgi:hypothetical protein